MINIRTESKSRLVRPQVSPSNIELTRNLVAADQRFVVSYNCDELLQKHKQYFDTI